MKQLGRIEKKLDFLISCEGVSLQPGRGKYCSVTNSYLPQEVKHISGEELYKQFLLAPPQ